MELIKAQELGYCHANGFKLEGISFSLSAGETLAVLGANGSGKSTLGKLLNALLSPASGSLTICGHDASDSSAEAEIRKSCVLVFKEPDEQFVSSYLEEDVAFGPLCRGLDREQTAAAVRQALELTGLSSYERRSPQLLPLAQKRRAALAGALACGGDVLVLDELTSDLSAYEREGLLAICRKYCGAERGLVLLSSDAEEAALADRVLLLSSGRTLACGSPEAVLSDAQLLAEAGLELPFPQRVYYDLLSAGAGLESCPVTMDELVKQLCR